MSIDPALAALLEAAVDPAMIVDRDGRIRAANHEAAANLGKASVDDVLGANLFELLPPDLAGPRREQLAGVAASGRGDWFRDVYKGRVYASSVTPVPGEDGEISGAAVICADVTDRETTEEELRRERQRHFFLMEALPGFALLVNRDSVLYENNASRKLFGRLKGRPTAACVMGDEASCLQYRAVEAIEGEKMLEWEWTDAQSRTFQVFAHPMSWTGGENVALVIGIDITGRKHSERRLRDLNARLEELVEERTRDLAAKTTDLERSNKELRILAGELEKAGRAAEAATRAKSDFLASMSHEIRTPLNAILGMADLTLREGVEASQERRLKVIREAGEALLGVVNDILDLSKVEAGKLLLEEIDFNLRDLLDNLRRLFESQAKARGLYLNMRIGEETPEVVRGDPTRIRQVLVNLISNGLKYTTEGGVTLSAGFRDGTALFSVADTGLGVPREKRELIFEAFTQADASTTREYGGTGLGLAICRRLARLMGGDIVVAAGRKGGSVFRFTLRLKAGGKDKARAVRCREGGGPAAPMRVLLAEDNAMARELITSFLGGLGHEVACAEDGRKALDILRRERFDVVLMDGRMPGLNGDEAARAVRSGTSGALDPGVPIIALTAEAMKGDREKFLEAGMNDYVTKPVNLDRLLEAVAPFSPKAPKASDSAPRAAEKGSGAAPDAGEEDAPVLERERALARLNGMEGLLEKITGRFLRGAPRDLEALRRAVDKGDSGETRLRAHTIKGNAASVGALRLSRLALELETAAKDGDAGAFAEGFRKVEEAVAEAAALLDKKRNPGG